MEKIHQNSSLKSDFNNLKFIKEYFGLITFSLLAILLINDYFIFTDVFNLNQAYFFNNLLGVIAQEQPIFMIFIFIPVLFIVFVLIILYKIQFIFLSYFFDEVYASSYRKFNNNNILIKTFLVAISIAIIIYGDLAVYQVVIFIYDMFENTQFKMTILSFLSTTYLVYLIYNSIIFILILFLSANFIIKLKSPTIITFYLGFFIGLKLIAYPLLQFIPYLKNIQLGSFGFFILLNFAFLIPSVIIVVVNKFKFKNNSIIEKKNKIYLYISKSITFVIILFGINLYFYNLNSIYQKPYNEAKFWTKIVSSNSLIQSTNISLLLSPLKIVHDNQINIDLVELKDKINKKFTSNEIEKKEIVFKNLNYYYIPFKNYRLVFLQNKINKIVLTVYGKFKDDRLVKTLDVGYINYIEKDKNNE